MRFANFVKWHFVFGCSLLVALTVPQVAACAVYNFSFAGMGLSELSGGHVDVVGQFETDLTSNVTSMTGYVSSSIPDESGDITGLMTTGTLVTFPGGFFYDFVAPNGEVDFAYSNTFDVDSKTFPDAGTLFSFGNASFANIYNFDGAFLSTYLPDNGPDYLKLDPTGVLFIPGDQGTLSVTAVPEVSTWTMLMQGFAGVGVMAFRRKLNVAAARTGGIPARPVPRMSSSACAPRSARACRGAITLPCEEHEMSTSYESLGRRIGLVPRAHHRGA